MSKEADASLLRIVDANLNRLKEGIRVIEDLFRYLYEDRTLAYELKELRHSIKLECYKSITDSRDIEGDILRTSTNSEKTNKSPKDIVISNFKRAQEASRVLEEICKSLEVCDSEVFKSVRYTLYSLEKKAFAAF
ncbi:MAG: thiamine-phosphate pyrophosphorylase [Campylobacterales bacterium]